MGLSVLGFAMVGRSGEEIVTSCQGQERDHWGAAFSSPDDFDKSRTAAAPPLPESDREWHPSRYDTG
jgi:hypothetical protein